MSFDDLIDDGVIEYLDVNEMNNDDTLIAIDEEDILATTSHMEVCSLLGCPNSFISIFSFYRSSHLLSLACVLR